ncbi:hypothetical protein Tco_1296983, partial [Tanacetum coccineum]
NIKMKPGIENMTISEYFEYEAAKERNLWDDVRSRRSPTHYDEVDFSSSLQNKRAENIKQMGHDIVQDSIWEQDDDSEEDQEEDAPATKSILDELLEEFEDEILNVTMVDEEADFNPTKDLEELERLLAKEPQSNFTEIQVHSVIINTEPFLHTQLMNPLYGVFKTSKACKVDRDILSPRRWLVKLPMMLDIVRGSRLGAWLRACCLFIFLSKSRGVFRSNSTLIFNVHFLNVQ